MNPHGAPPQIYLAREGAQTGPYEIQHVRELVARGAYSPDDLAWYPGAPSWMALRDVPGFHAPPAPPPLPYASPHPFAASHPYAAPQPWESAGRVHYAGFWIRVVAVIIDTLVLFIPLAIAQNLMFGAATGDLAADLHRNVGAMLMNGFVQWIYQAAMDSSEWQGTVGKRVLGLRVTGLRGERIGFGRATVRYFAEFLSAILLGVGYIMVAFTERKQALHDRIAETVVVRG